MAPANRRILISGAGIAGPALAHRLLQYRFEPTIIERAAAFRDGGYMIDVWGTGYDIVERYGLLKMTTDRAYLFDRLKFVNEWGRERSGLGGRVLRAALNGRFFSIPRGDLARIIYDTISAQVEVLYGASIQSVDQCAQDVVVELSTGQRRHFDLLIGADGLHSCVPKLVFGDEAQFERYLGYVAASFIANGYPHRDDATYVSFAKPPICNARGP